MRLGLLSFKLLNKPDMKFYNAFMSLNFSVQFQYKSDVSDEILLILQKKKNSTCQRIEPYWKRNIEIIRKLKPGLRTSFKSSIPSSSFELKKLEPKKNQDRAFRSLDLFDFLEMFDLWVCSIFIFVWLVDQEVQQLSLNLEDWKDPIQIWDTLRLFINIIEML